MFSQHPLIPLIFCVILIAILINQCFVKHRFMKVKVILSFFLTFVVVFLLVFYNNIKNGEFWLKESIMNWILLGLDIGIGILLFTTIDFSLSSERFQKELTKSLDETKFYVVLDKKDKIKDASSLLLKDLNLQLSDIYGHNFFDVLETKYRIIGFNGSDCNKQDLLKFYEKYDKRADPSQKNNKIEIEIQNDNAEVDALYFYESLIFSDDKYKGRILMGEKKDEESLMGIESDLAFATKDLELIKSRFTVLLEKTSEGIFFNNISEGNIWCHDILVKRLSLTGNSLDIKEFYSMIHSEDLPLYEEKMKSLPTEYSLTYRFKTAGGYIYVKEEGKKIVVGKTIELCGIMVPMDDYHFAKTDTILDTLQGQPELNARLSILEQTDKIYEVVYFRIASVPEINQKFGRAIGNSILSQYVNFFKQNFVTDNQIYRVEGLDFVAILTDYRKMDMLKNNLVNGEKILHSHANYMNDEVKTEVFMGISRCDDHPSHKNVLNNAKEAFRFCSNPQFNSNFAFYKDIK